MSALDARPSWHEREQIAKVRDIIRASKLEDGDAEFWPLQLSYHGDLIDKVIVTYLEKFGAQREQHAAQGTTCTDEYFLDAVALYTKIVWLETVMASEKKSAKRGRKKV